MEDITDGEVPPRSRGEFRQRLRQQLLVSHHASLSLAQPAPHDPAARAWPVRANVSPRQAECHRWVRQAASFNLVSRRWPSSDPPGSSPCGVLLRPGDFAVRILFRPAAGRSLVVEALGPGGHRGSRDVISRSADTGGTAAHIVSVRSPRQRQHRRCRTAMPGHALPTRTCQGGNSPAPERLPAGWPGGQSDLGAGRPGTGQPPPLALCWIPGGGMRQVHRRSIGGRSQALAASLRCSRGGT